MSPDARLRGYFLTEDPEKVEATVLSQGWFVNFLRRFPTPKLALPGRRLYRALVQGSGFCDPVEDAEPLIGFYATVFVRAGSLAEAERKARHRVKSRWQIFHREAEGDLILLVEECEPIADRFKFRSMLGFSFYSEEDEEALV